MANIGRVGGAGASGAGDQPSPIGRKAPNKLRGRTVTLMGSQNLLDHPASVAPKSGGDIHFKARQMPSGTDLHYKY